MSATPEAQVREEAPRGVDGRVWVQQILVRIEEIIVGADEPIAIPAVARRIALEFGTNVDTASRHVARVLWKNPRIARTGLVSDGNDIAMAVWSAEKAEALRRLRIRAAQIRCLLESEIRTVAPRDYGAMTDLLLRPDGRPIVERPEPPLPKATYSCPENPEDTGHAFCSFSAYMEHRLRSHREYAPMAEEDEPLSEEDSEVVNIARRVGKCAECGGRIGKGDPIVYKGPVPGKPKRHSWVHARHDPSKGARRQAGGRAPRLRGRTASVVSEGRPPGRDGPSGRTTRAGLASAPLHKATDPERADVADEAIQDREDEDPLPS